MFVNNQKNQLSIVPVFQKVIKFILYQKCKEMKPNTQHAQLRMKVNTTEGMSGLVLGCLCYRFCHVLELEQEITRRHQWTQREAAVCKRWRSDRKDCSDSDNPNVKKTRPSGVFNGICEEMWHMLTPQKLSKSHVQNYWFWWTF